MTYQLIQNIPVWGEPDPGAVDQIVNCAAHGGGRGVDGGSPPGLCGADWGRHRVWGQDQPVRRGLRYCVREQGRAH